jgi:glucosamine 6-phosphate synthetase-like amidotransferase/phosphosugar isomerase protein
MLVAYPREPSPKLGSQGVPAQLFAYHLTREKGYDPDHPRSIQKVTETR